MLNVIQNVLVMMSSKRMVMEARRFKKLIRYGLSFSGDSYLTLPYLTFRGQPLTLVSGWAYHAKISVSVTVSDKIKSYWFMTGVVARLYPCEFRTAMEISNLFSFP